MVAGTWLKAVQVRSLSRRGRGRDRLRRLLAVTVATVLLLAGLSVPQWVSQLTGSVAEASGTGTGGSFVPAAGRFMDTRYGSKLAANTWTTITAAGQFGIPAGDGATSLVVSVTAFNDTGTPGQIFIQPTTSGGGAVPFLVYNGNDVATNSAVIELS